MLGGGEMVDPSNPTPITLGRGTTSVSYGTVALLHLVGIESDWGWMGGGGWGRGWVTGCHSGVEGGRDVVGWLG